MRLRLPMMTGVLALCASATGCLSTTRAVQRTQVVAVYRTATVEELEAAVNARFAATHTLDARVLVTASTGSSNEGAVKEYTSLRGFIFARQPGQLRVLLQKPYLGSTALDMVTDGKTFTLVINPLTGPAQVMEGLNAMSKPGATGLRSLRPDVFGDSLLVPAIGVDDFVTLTESRRTLPLAKHAKAADVEPDYELTVLRRKAGNVLRPIRVLHISRVDMLPYEQDIFDEAGRLVTRATYAKYAPFAGVSFPQEITITRPLDELSLKVDVTKLVLNGPLEDDQFEIKVPAGAVVERLE